MSNNKRKTTITASKRTVKKKPVVHIKQVEEEPVVTPEPSTKSSSFFSDFKFVLLSIGFVILCLLFFPHRIASAKSGVKIFSSLFVLNSCVFAYLSGTFNQKSWNTGDSRKLGLYSFAWWGSMLIAILLVILNTEVLD